MPRLRSATRQSTSLRPVPDDSAVVVDLPPEMLTAEPPKVDYGSSVAAITQTSSAFTTEPQIRVRPAATPPEGDGDDVEEDPRKALEEAERRARDRIRAAEQRAAEVTAWAQRTATAAAQQARTADEANLDSISNAIAAANAEAETAQREWAEAMQRGDFAAAGVAQRKMYKAESRISTLEAGQAELEDQIKRRPATPPLPQPPPAAAGNVEALLAQLPALNDAERDWIREHPDSLMVPANKARMERAFLDAQEWGIPRGSKEYFDLFNDRLGYARRSSPAAEPETQEEEPMPVVDQPRRVAAPPSRSGTLRGVQESPTRIMLTPEQRAYARISGVSEVDYAAGVARLREAKKQGLYQ